MLRTGQKAPAFESVNQHNERIALADFLGKHNVVLYFYPKDDTPGCTIEANDFTRLADEFAAHDTVVIGVSRDDCASHVAFIDKFGLKVDLLADTDGSVCQAYDVWQQKRKAGETRMGIVRSTFVIDKNGDLVTAEYGVDPDGHAEAVLNIVKRL